MLRREKARADAPRAIREYAGAGGKLGRCGRGRALTNVSGLLLRDAYCSLSFSTSSCLSCARAQGQSYARVSEGRPVVMRASNKGSCPLPLSLLSLAPSLDSCPRGARIIFSSYFLKIWKGGLLCAHMQRAPRCGKTTASLTHRQFDDVLHRWRVCYRRPRRHKHGHECLAKTMVSCPVAFAQPGSISAINNVRGTRSAALSLLGKAATGGGL